MSAPEVGDRVRVIAGQWTGWEGVVLEDMGDGWWWLKVSALPSGRPCDWQRPVHVDYLRKVPTARTKPPSGDDDGSGAPVEPRDAHGAHRGGKR